MRLFRVLAVVATGIAAAVLLSRPGLAARAPVYALVGARALPVSGPAVENATVVLRDGVIEAVGSGLAAPPDARVIDAKGLVITPGLVDGFGSIGLPAPTGGGPRGGPGGAAGAPAPAASAPPIEPQALALDRVRPADVAKARDAGITTALVIPRDGVVPGQSALIDLAGNTADEMAVRQPLALHLQMTTLGRQYPGSLMGTMALARQALLDAAHYRDEWAAYERSPRGRTRPRYDASLEAWRKVVAGTEPLVVTAPRANDLRRAASLAEEFHVKVIAAGATGAFEVADVVKARALPLLVSVNFDPPRPAGGGFGGPPDEEKERADVADAERNPAALDRAGIRFALVSGHATDFLAGVRKAIDRGLPKDVALRAVTLTPAEILGVADRLGSLEKGKIANVVAWSGEPLTSGARARYVFVDGRLFQPDEPSPSPGASPRGEARAGGPAAASAATPPEPRRLATPPSQDFGGRPLAITHATLLTAGPLGRIEDGTVLVRNGKIAALGRDVAVPAGAEVIDARGRFVTPGLIDAHSHTAIEGGVNECTSSVTAEVRIADVIDDRDPNIYRELAGGVTTINSLHGSCNAIGGQNAVLKLRWGQPPDKLLFAGAPRGVKFALGENPKRSNFSVPGPRRFPGTRMGVEAVIRQAFQEARDYKREWDDYERAKKAGRPDLVAPRRNLQMEELRDILDGKVLVHAHCYRADEILMLIGIADEFGFKIRTFQHVLEGYKVASEIARHGAGASTFSDWWAYKMEAWDAIPYNAAIMAAHGVSVSLNSDSDELARRLYWEAAKAVKYGGVPEDQALRMVTANPAWQLGIDARVGTLEVGKDADIAIFSAHPFSPEARVEKTLVDGVVYFDRARDLALREGPAKTALGGGAR